MRLLIGDTIQWVAKAGTLKGQIGNIKLDLNAAGQTIPWLTVENVVCESTTMRRDHSNVVLPGTDGYFAMMKLEVLAQIPEEVSMDWIEYLANYGYSK